MTDAVLSSLLQRRRNWLQWTVDFCSLHAERYWRTIHRLSIATLCTAFIDRLTRHCRQQGEEGERY